METLGLVLVVFFLLSALLLFWAAFAIQRELVEDAILSVGFAIFSLGLCQILKFGWLQGLSLPALFFLTR
ncbi:MAG: hypothetical protein AB1491_11630 [Thermodesulfobacteriota bacterium]